MSEPEADALPAVARPQAQVWLRFGGEEVVDEDHTLQDLSALALDGDTLWTAGDERAAVERFVRLPDGSFGRHVKFRIGELLDLPDGSDGEMDIEGLDVDRGCLWVVGSHSLRRKKPDPEKEQDQDELIERLGRIDCQPNRYTLACLPLGQDTAGLPAPVARTDGPKRKAAVLPFAKRGSRLSKLLHDDEHLAPFIGVPAKENGFDIEGLAASGERLFLGLRGPVLRGYAIILELRVKHKGGKLKLLPVREDGPLVRKHFLELAGLGVRDLTIDGQDLLILAGPTLAHDGRHAVIRWPGALKEDGPSLHRERDLRHLLDLPELRDRDRAEGIGLPKGDGQGREQLLVVYDSPHPRRIDRKGRAVRADLFRLPR